MLFTLIRKFILWIIGAIIGLIIAAGVFIYSWFFADDGDDSSNNSSFQQQQQQQQQGPSDDQVSSNDNTQQQNTSSGDVQVKPLINLPSPPPLQKDASGNLKEGIFYFTEIDAPKEGLSVTPDHNVWLIQLSRLGKKIEVDHIEKKGEGYDIYVRFTPQSDPQYSLEPSFGFFEAPVEQMPITSQFRIYDVNIPSVPIWPKS